MLTKLFILSTIIMIGYGHLHICLTEHPEMPYISPPLTFKPGDKYLFEGMMIGSGGKIAVNFGNIIDHGNFGFEEDRPFHIDLRLNESNVVVRNHYQKGVGFGAGERDGGIPVKQYEPFDLLVEMMDDHFRISINYKHFCEYKYRLPLSKAKHIMVYREGAKVAQVSRLV